MAKGKILTHEKKGVIFTFILILLESAERHKMHNFQQVQLQRKKQKYSGSYTDTSFSTKASFRGRVVNQKLHVDLQLWDIISPSKGNDVQNMDPNLG